MIKYKEDLLRMLHGENFSIDFSYIDVYKQGRYVCSFTDENCNGADSSIRSSYFNPAQTLLDINIEDTWEKITNLGVFQNCYSGFTFLNLQWHVYYDDPKIFSLVTILSGSSGIKRMHIVANDLDYVGIELDSSMYKDKDTLVLCNQPNY